MFRSPAHRRYVVRLAIAMVSYLAALMLADNVIGNQSVTGPLAFGVALLPGLCIASVFWVLGRFVVEETDEYQRMLLVRQILIATGLTMSIVSVWGFLAQYELVPHGDAYYPLWVFFIGLGVGAVFNKFTLGDSGRC